MSTIFDSITSNEYLGLGAAALLKPTALIGATSTYALLPGDLLLVDRDAGNVVTAEFPGSPTDGDILGVSLMQGETGDKGGAVIFDPNGNAIGNFEGARRIRCGQCYVVFRWSDAAETWTIMQQGGWDFPSYLANLNMFDQLTTSNPAVDVLTYVTQSNNSVYQVDWSVTLRESTLGDVGMIAGAVAVKRDDSGTVSVGTPTAIVSDLPGNLAGSVVAAVADGSDIKVQLTRAAGIDTKWQAEARIRGLD